MSPVHRRLLRYGVPAAVFLCGAMSLMAGWSPGLAWSLIVVSLGWAAEHMAKVVASPSDRRVGAGSKARSIT